MTTLLFLWFGFPRWLSWTIFYTLFAVNLIVDAWLLILLYRHNVRKRLPWFVLYVVWESIAACVGPIIWLINPKLYVTVFWWMEGPRLVLMLGAVRESFLNVFIGFTSLRWFPWVIRTVIATVVLYSIWKAIYAPPVQSSLATAFLIGAEFLFRWCIAAVGVLTIVLARVFELPARTREDAIISGFGIASVAFVATVLSRSLFGTRFTFFTQYLPDVGYFMAALLWIRTFSRPEEEFGLKELGMDAEQIAQELHRYGESARRLLRKKQ
jgi:hypothetical protein